jgi:hypothetical protein
MSKGIRRFGFIALRLTVGTVWMHKSVMDQRAGNAVFALHLCSQEVVTRPLRTRTSAATSSFATSS